jgi:tetratricopeptide (TPR) repeat protein
VELDGRPLGTSPGVAALPVGEHRLELRGEDGARVGETLRVQEGTFVTRRFELASDDLPEDEVAIVESEIEIEPDAIDRDATPRPRATAEAPRELLAEARTLRRADRWRDAATMYRRLLREHPRSGEAHTALVSLGDLLLDRLDQPAEAARAYVRYVREGGGSLAPEARWGVIRARRQQGDASGEREAIADFLRHHPDDARAKSLR